MRAKPATRRYLRIDDVVYQSDAFRTLHGGALKLWIDLRTQLNGFNNGNLDATMSTLSKRGWTSTATLQVAIKELMQRGLIDRTRHGKPGPYRICSLFRFTDLATPKDEKHFVDGKPATYEFKNWRAPEQKKRASETEATLLRKLERNSFRNRSVDPESASETEARKKRRNGRKPAPVLIPH